MEGEGGWKGGRDREGRKVGEIGKMQRRMEIKEGLGKRYNYGQQNCLGTCYICIYTCCFLPSNDNYYDEFFAYF